MSVEGEATDTAQPPSTFAELYRSEIDRQVRRAFLMVASAELAHDVVHDAMIEVYRRWDSIERPGAYLNRAVLNGCREAMRRDAVRRRNLGRLVERGDAPTREVLDDVLQSLPFLQRGAVVLRFYGGMSIAEIAESMGCSTGSVGPAIDRGLKKMRRVLQ